jgi:two-component system, chemotaxis family, chemotaxis protein CheY
MAYNILLVDDSPAMRSFLRRVLDLSGLDVGRCLEAGNGQEALDLLCREWIDLVLTDLNMPVMDGEELVRRLAADESFRTVPVLVVSTDRTEARVRQLLALGARGYVAKPFLPETLRAEMDRALEVIHAG